jgi:two-component system response regulator AtoC
MIKNSILIIDDELGMCSLLQLALKTDYNIKYATDAETGLELIKQESFDLVLLDLILGVENGIDVLKSIKDYDKNIIVIIMTAFGSIKTTVEAMKLGAFTYLTKPLDIDELKVFIEQALGVKRLSEDIVFLSYELKSYFKYHEMVGESDKMQQIYDKIEKLKKVDSNVLITGESGTGKELVARAIHSSGKRKEERFVVINCAAIPENLLEEELFGHKQGSFTGAIEDKKGKFEIADGGTVFLDEIGDMQIGLQSKLLRVLEQKEVTPIGCTKPRKIDVRIIAATNKNLSDMINNGGFREDLFYRLNVMSISMPPLRERKEDIPLLCQHFIKKFNHEQNKKVKGITKEVQQIIQKYDYPGNVRQLANIIEHAMILASSDVITIKDIPIEIERKVYNDQEGYIEEYISKYLSNMTMKEIERTAIEATLQKNGGRRGLTAKDLGISVRNLQNKINEYHLYK